MTPPLPRLLQQMCWGLVISFPLLVLIGQRWQHAAGGTGTRGVMAVAAFICPAASGKFEAVRVADGAHRLDRAVLRQIAAQLHMGLGCFVPVGADGARTDRRRDSSKGEKVRGMGKSM